MNEDQRPGWRRIPIAAAIIEPGNSVNQKTGDWRTLRPGKDDNKCVKCLICWIYCPDSAIEVASDGGVRFNYDYCKGCGICATECPTEAIVMIEEGARE